jgi:hypothetical protein
MVENTLRDSQTEDGDSSMRADEIIGIGAEDLEDCDGEGGIDDSFSRKYKLKLNGEHTPVFRFRNIKNLKVNPLKGHKKKKN